MISLKTANRRVGSLFAVAALMLATVTPGLVPAFASAAQVTERSVALSSSSAGAEAVSYTVNFTSVEAAKSVVIDFCNDTPLIGAACSAPAGFDVSGATVTGVDFVKAAASGANDANTLVVSAATEEFTELEAVSIPFTGVDNPSNSGALYVRIVTYDGADIATAETSALAYASDNLGSGNVDQGSAAVSITDTVGVSGAVLESMTFCVSSEVIDGESCTDADDANPLDAPVLELGETSGDITALTSSAVSTGSLYSQISTNAASGAIVSLKSDTAGCGGLVRFGTDPATVCDIEPALATDIAANQAKFGLKVAAAADPTTGTSNGAYQIFGTGGTPYYSESVFKLNYVSGDATGITGPYGDQILDTAEAPVNNKNVELIFGASVSNSTPAGLYSADLSLIATGKF